MDPEITLELLFFGATLLGGVFSTKLASRIGVPALVLFIALGMVLGSDVSGLVYFDDARLAQLVATAALVLILFEGGLQIRWAQMRPVLVPSVVLATAGVAITVLITGLIAWQILDLELPTALLLAATVGSTDAAAIFAVLRNQRIRQRLKVTVETESGLNDPMALFLTLVFMEWVQADPPSILGSIGFLVLQMGLGLVIGLAVARLVARRLFRIHFDSGGLYPLLLVSIAVVTYAVTTMLRGSGIVAVYVLGVALNSVELPFRQSIVRFHEGMAALAQIVMFSLLGLLVFPRQMLSVVVPGLLITAGLMFVARPVAVWLCTFRMRYSLQERLLLSWAGLKGAVPIILATFPLVAGIPQSGLIFNMVFFAVLLSALVQGATISPLARWLGLVEAAERPKAVALELVAMERCNAEMLEVEVPQEAEVAGKRLAELNLPQNVTVSAIVRNNQVVTPRGGTRLEAGDVLFVLVNKEHRQEVLELFESDE